MDKIVDTSILDMSYKDVDNPSVSNSDYGQRPDSPNQIRDGPPHPNSNDGAQDPWKMGYHRFLGGKVQAKNDQQVMNAKIAESGQNAPKNGKKA